jgi:AcrR family transcriptional regulator
MNTQPNRFTQYAHEEGIPEVGQRILDSAMRLFAQKGYAATSVREIVQDAEATNPMLYYYFQNKEGVFLKLLEIAFALQEQAIERTLAMDAPFYDKIRALFNIHIETLFNSPHAMRFIYTALFSAQESQPNFDHHHKRTISIKRVQSLFDEGVRCGEFQPAEGFSTLFLAMHFMALVSNQLMLTLALIDETPDQTIPTEAYLLVNEQERERILRCFFFGAGSLSESTHP